MKGYIAYGKKVGLTVVEHKELLAVEFKRNDKSLWYDMHQVINGFRKKDIEAIALVLAER